MPNWGLSGVIGNLYYGSSEGRQESRCGYLYLRDHSSFFFNSINQVRTYRFFSKQVDFYAQVVRKLQLYIHQIEQAFPFGKLNQDVNVAFWFLFAPNVRPKNRYFSCPARIAPREYAVRFTRSARSSRLIYRSLDPYNIIRRIMSFLSRSTQESGLSREKKKTREIATLYLKMLPAVS